MTRWTDTWIDKQETGAAMKMTNGNNRKEKREGKKTEICDSNNHGFGKETHKWDQESTQTFTKFKAEKT